MPTSPFYRTRFDAVGVHPDDVRTLADIAKLPFTTKQHLRDTYPFGMFAVPREKVARIHALLGHDGQADRGGLHEERHRRLGRDGRAAFDPARRAGGRATIVHVAYGYGLFTGGLGAHYGAVEARLTRWCRSPAAMTERQITLIQDFKPRVIMVTPSYMLSILDEFPSPMGDRTPRETSLAVGIFGAEPWTNAHAGGDRALLRHACRGLSTACPRSWARASPTSASRPRGRPARCGRTTSTRRSSIPRPAACCPTGEVGELVFTSLTKEASLPIIRYRTRDLTRLLPGTRALHCGASTKITGRSDDIDHPARGQRLPDPGRGTGPQVPRAPHRISKIELTPPRPQWTP